MSSASALTYRDRSRFTLREAIFELHGTERRQNLKRIAVSELDEIQASLLGESPQTRDGLVRDIGSSTVALFAVTESREGDRLQLAGTGTLVIVAGSHYVLTAAHVWEEILKSAARIGITLKENVDHQFLMEGNSIVATGPQKPTSWGEWGPDLTFLRIPPAYLGSIYAHRVFYNLTIERTALGDVNHIETWALMGTPKASGEFTRMHADLQIQGIFPQVGQPHIHEGFDYLDLDIDVSSPGTPQDFRGVSGGGLWKVLIYKSVSTGKVHSRTSLEGVAFHQSDLEKGRRIIRCHGLQSIRAAMPRA